MTEDEISLSKLRELMMDREAVHGVTKNVLQSMGSQRLGHDRATEQQHPLFQPYHLVGILPQS